MSTSKKIDRPIISYSVKKNVEASAEPIAAPVVPVAEPSAPSPALFADSEGASNVIQMHEKLARPDALEGSSYKIKTPLSEHSLYVTINDIVLNPGTPWEKRRPFEIFINSKNMEHYQWIVALTLIISAVFRKGGDVAFLVEELRSVFDPKGGYFKRGGKYMPSLVAEIGEAIDTHLKKIGMIQDRSLDSGQQALVDEKRREAHSREPVAPAEPDDDYPAEAVLCKKCHTRALVMMDGCMTCLSCGDSKCG
ncbi:NrdJb [Gammaproteobacteria bacterium]|nr:NrdJb [Gammaproteobacteria bacterium]